jgi:serine/threonine protein phosphatase PrpC/RNA polymerase subunit RPABC4/transcription elongation factor Spt4
MVLRCQNCNAEVASDDVFCPNCGTSLNLSKVKLPVLQKASTIVLKNDPINRKDEKEEVNLEPVESAVAVEVAPTAEPTEQFWICKQCNTLNPLNEEYCEMCGAMKVAVTKPAVEKPSASISRAEAEAMAALQPLVEQISKFRPDSTGTIPGWRYYSASGTHEGKGRLGNPDEDSVFTLEVRRFFEAKPESFAFWVVADGMGGQAAGEVASRSAIQSVSALVTAEMVVPWLAGATFSVEETQNILKKAILEAHSRILGDNRVNRRDSGTTFTACVAMDNQAIFANVGDSRAYLFRPKSAGEETNNGLTALDNRKTVKLNKAGEPPKEEAKPETDLPYKIERVTRDQSLVQDLIDQGLITIEESYSHNQRNVVLAALGAPEDVIPVDVYYRELKSGDRILIGSDGLWEMMRDKMMVEIFMVHQDHLQDTVNALIDLANQNGGVDNISAVVVDVVKK